ncbi:MAG: hypothetical protein ACQ9MH_01395 [Nitrospinales bacterium]
MTNEKKYSLWLSILLLIFCFHVVAQFIQYVSPVSFLPPFGDWQSGALSYEILVVTQIIIIFVLLRFVLRVANGKEIPDRKSGQVYLIFGLAYFVLMLFRLGAGLTFATDHNWFSARIPTLFHLVLASFLILLGFYHSNFATDR